METLITAEDVKSGLSLIGSEGLTCDELAPGPWGSGGEGIEALLGNLSMAPCAPC